MEQIDVKSLIAPLDVKEHIAKADAYFAALTEDSAVFRKPWAYIHEAPAMALGIGTILDGLQLFHGARVLDFGCGLGWMSSLLADLGCEVTAVDVSHTAIGRARHLAQTRCARPECIRFMTYDGHRLDLADGSMDRIVAFDALHHVPDQAAVLGEMYRLLGDGGVAGFHEPGPRHSQLPQSQAEMRNFQVIENDIVLEDLAAVAEQIGFIDLRVAYQPGRAVLFPLDEFNHLVEGNDPAVALRYIQETRSEFDNLRIFFLRKPGEATLDSRSARGLQHQIRVERIARAGREGQAVEVELVATNCGVATWLPSGDYIGAVHLGAQLLAADGHTLDLDYYRARIVEQALPPKGQLRATVEIPLPAGLEPGSYGLALDFVAEGITWFGERDSIPVRLSIPN